MEDDRRPAEVDSAEHHSGLPPGMPASREMKRIFSRELSKSEQYGYPGRPFIYRQRLQALSRVHAGRDRVATIRADGGAAAAERSQEDDCAECGEKNGSHNSLVTVFLTIRKQSRR